MRTAGRSVGVAVVLVALASCADSAEAEVVWHVEGFGTEAHSFGAREISVRGLTVGPVAPNESQVVVQPGAVSPPGVVRSELIWSPAHNRLQLAAIRHPNDANTCRQGVRAIGRGGRTGERMDVIECYPSKQLNVTGTDSNDYIYMGKLPDVRDRGGGAERFYTYVQGHKGYDRVIGGTSADWLYGGEGRDRLEGNGNADYLFGERDRDLLQGGNGPDSLWGGPEADDLYGEDDGDRLSGGSDNDNLVGQQGRDIVVGGTVPVSQSNPDTDLATFVACGGCDPASDTDSYFTDEGKTVSYDPPHEVAWRLLSGDYLRCAGPDDEVQFNGPGPYADTLYDCDPAHVIDERYRAPSEVWQP